MSVGVIVAQRDEALAIANERLGEHALSQEGYAEVGVRFRIGGEEREGAHR